MLGGTDPSGWVWRIGVSALSADNDKVMEDTEGVDGAEGINELARDRDGVRGIKEFARDMDGMRGRSGSGAGGAKVHPKSDVKIAISDGCVSEAGGDDLESTVVGV